MPAEADLVPNPFVDIVEPDFGEKFDEPNRDGQLGFASNQPRNKNGVQSPCNAPGNGFCQASKPFLSRDRRRSCRGRGR